MAKFVVAKNAPADMSNFDIGGFNIIGSDVLTLSDTVFHVESTDGFNQTYIGTGFSDTNADDIPDSGTLTQWVNDFNGNVLFTLSEFSMDWEDYLNFVAVGDSEDFLRTMFSGKDSVIGGDRNDVLLGYGGNDVINGGKGKDHLDGGAGRDNIIGGDGKDTLTGGSARDTFVYAKLSDSTTDGDNDLITDFSAAQHDKIDLHLIDADSTQGGNQAFFLGGSTFTNAAGELIQLVLKDGRLHLQGDVDGDGFADFDIGFVGKMPPFEDGDFVF